MRVEDLDNELTIKSKEILKMILKKPSVMISFEYAPEGNVPEVTVIKQNNHTFILYKEKLVSEVLNINNKYNFIINEIKDKTSLSNEDKIKFINKKFFYLKPLSIFFGKITNLIKEEFFSYKLNYNSVIMNLNKQEYDKFQYYCSYVFKLKQLLILNKELNINQEFTIIFDDDKTINDLYKNINNNFKGIIHPIEIANNYEDDDDDYDEDDEDLSDLDD